jgi:hypothetical protein
VYLKFLLGLFFFCNSGFIYFNEEFAIGIVIVFLLSLFYKLFVKIVLIFFFFSIEFFYITYLYLIKCNKLLLKRLQNLYLIIKLVYVYLNSYIMQKFVFNISDALRKVILNFDMYFVFFLLFQVLEILLLNCFKNGLNFYFDELYLKNLYKFF